MGGKQGTATAGSPSPVNCSREQGGGTHKGWPWAGAGATWDTDAPSSPCTGRGGSHGVTEATPAKFKVRSRIAPPGGPEGDSVTAHSSRTGLGVRVTRTQRQTSASGTGDGGAAMTRRAFARRRRIRRCRAGPGWNASWSKAHAVPLARRTANRTDGTGWVGGAAQPNALDICGTDTKRATSGACALGAEAIPNRN